MKVSIITPSFNQGRFIERTLKSVACQSGAEIEHVIIDGGSTDNTVEILKNFRPSVRWVSEKDHGQADAINKGIQATDGEIIGWLNSDDVYYSGAIARVVDFFEKNPHINVVYGMADHIDVEDRAYEAYPTEQWDFERLKETCFICQPALFFRRLVVNNHGYLDQSLMYCMDYEYWLRLGKFGERFGYIKEKLAGSRMYAENKTSRAQLEVHKEINNMLKKNFGSVPDSWLFGYAYTGIKENINLQPHSMILILHIWLRVIAASIMWNRSLSKNVRNKIIVKFRKLWC